MDMESTKKNQEVINDDSIRTFAKEHIESYKNEVSILQNIVNAQSPNIIPMALHDLCVIEPAIGHLFFKPLRELYACIDLRRYQEEDFKEGVRTTIKVLDKLILEEKHLYESQAQQLIIERKKLKQKWNLREESQWFEHVVYDVSIFADQFFNIIRTGLVVTEDMNGLMNVIFETIHNKAADILVLREKAVKNCEILAK